MMQARRGFTLGAAAAFAGIAGGIPAARADAFPTRAVRLIIPYGQGTVSDRLGRLVATGLASTWGHSVVAENVVGAGGVLGVQTLARSPADGHTIGMIASNFAMNPAVHSTLTFDTERDFVPLVHLTYNVFAFVVHPSFPARTVKELIEQARARPRSIDFASSGTGGSPHLAVELFASLAGIQLTHIPYRSNGQAMTDLLGGQVPLMATSASTLLPHIKSGALRALAVSGANRSPLLPDVPTLAEAGVPGYDMKNWNGLLAPAGTPPAIADRIARDVSAIAKTPAFEEQVHAMGAEIELLQAPDFGKRIATEVALWKRVAREARIHVN